ncbi:putative UDP-N-acetylglucosamine--peptide N-acetylglucosaminyltransferase SPINDLY [Camellia lanceoleosa]|uniref:UDP-N-acetylglucosamine--peptide N-acetylglucosaminyltransferase SPINDLY n=1 Tax=Camellia lanceoleosa TaxID=1840588 RepID=A0ACC0ID51_9ERIC|nr:putative UDP-N-acetylglucosamine--peptide N-acetylglucosaminyltransferase SPINDLY [Camellia lanceoleosa]
MLNLGRVAFDSNAVPTVRSWLEISSTSCGWFGNDGSAIGWFFSSICKKSQDVAFVIDGWAFEIALKHYRKAFTELSILSRTAICCHVTPSQKAQSYQKALRADPSYKPAAEYLAIVLTDLETSLKLIPAYYNLGVVYSEMMQYDMALGCYEKALNRNMGVIYKNRGDLESALACYERCLALSPNFEIAKNNMAIALTDLGTKVKLEGDIDQGVEYYRKALYYNWHFADAMYNLGVAYGEILKFGMAIVFYELAFHINPHCAEACNNLGVIYKDRDNLDKVVECYQSLNNLGVVYTIRVQDLHPLKKSFFFGKDNMHFRSILRFISFTGKMDVASMIEKAIVANPTYAEAYNNLGLFILSLTCGHHVFGIFVTFFLLTW